MLKTFAQDISPGGGACFDQDNFSERVAAQNFRQHGVEVRVNFEQGLRAKVDPPVLRQPEVSARFGWLRQGWAIVICQVRDVAQQVKLFTVMLGSAFRLEVFARYPVIEVGNASGVRVPE